MTMAAHSPRFDKLSVMLASRISQPLLCQLATRLQAPLLESLCQDSNPNQRLDFALNQDPQSQNHDIALSAQILANLYQTSIADASILVAITHEARPRLLLTRRAANLSSHAGEVSCAGGKFEVGDGNNVVTALREACEETALPPSRVKIIGQLPPQVSKSGLSVRPIVALVDPDLILVPELGEIARIFWADFGTLIQQPLTEYQIRYPVQGRLTTLVTPSFLVDGETVWGLTGRVIASLLEIGFDRKVDWYYRLAP